MGNGTKAFLERLYGGEVISGGKSAEGDEGGFYDEGRAEGLCMLKQYGRPVKWRGFWSRLRLEGVGIHGETRDGFMLLVDEKASVLHQAVEPCRLTFAELCDRVLEWKWNKSVKTLASYGEDVGLAANLCETLGKRRASTIARQDLDAYVRYRKREIPWVSVCREMDFCRLVFSMGVGWKLLEHNPAPMLSEDPRHHLVEERDEHNAWAKRYDVVVFKLVKPSDVVRGLYMALEEDVGMSGEFDEEFWHAVFGSVCYVREGVIEKFLLPYLRLKGRCGSDLKVWDEVGKEAFRRAEAKPGLCLGERRKEQEVFLSTLEKEMYKSCLRCRLLAVERANRLFSKGYRYNVRGKWRMESRLGKNGTKSLQRAARRFLEMREGKE